jgi:hypothetical protein
MLRPSARSLSPRLLACAAALLVAGVLVVLPAGAAHADPAGDWLSWVNNLRASNGLAGLQYDAELSGLAQQRSAINAANKTLVHTGSLSAGVTSGWTRLAENIGEGSGIGDIGPAFVNSAAHRANLLNPAFTHVGIGVTIDDTGTMWVTQRFMAASGGASPAPQPDPSAADPAPTKPTPTPPPKPAPRTTTSTTSPAAAPAPAPVLVTPTPSPAEPQRVAAVLDALVTLG